MVISLNQHIVPLSDTTKRNKCLDTNDVAISDYSDYSRNGNYKFLQSLSLNHLFQLRNKMRKTDTESKK